MTRKLRETTDEDRTRIIEAYENQRSVADIAEILGLKRSTVHGIIEVYHKQGRTTKLARGGHRLPKLSVEHTQRIRGWIDEDCSITLRRLTDKCRDILGVAVSERTIARCIEGFSYTIKRIHLIPERRNDELAITTRATYSNAFLQLLTTMSPNHIIFVDEVGFSVSMRSRRGRSLRGTSPVHIIPALRTRNISVCCAINSGGIVHYLPRTRAYNGESFTGFLTELVEKLQERGLQSTVIILDNVPFHRNISAKGVIETAGHSLMFLPPYSPFLNPIENMFAKWKEGVRSKRTQNEEELMHHIKEGSALITNTDCEGFFRNMLGYVRRGLLREAILD
jgi:transposase